jgi:hypothetical protein
MRHLVATFPTRRAGRDAVIELEKRGVVDADRIEIREAPERSTAEVDREVVHQIAPPVLRGLAIGTVVGAVVGAGLTQLLGVDPQPEAPIAAALGVGAFGGAAGFFYGGARHIPVTEEALEMAAGEGEVHVVVDLNDGQDPAAVEHLLRDLGAELQSS